jgi:hypothetical protein
MRTYTAMHTSTHGMLAAVSKSSAPTQSAHLYVCACSYERDDESLGGATLLKGAPQAAGRLMEKVASAAGIAAKVC